MTAKILVTAIGQQIIAGVKVVENQETQERVAYWVQQPRVLAYVPNEQGNTDIRMVPYCYASEENEFSISADHIVAILEPRADIAEAWRKKVYPTVDEAAASEEVKSVTPEVVED